MQRKMVQHGRKPIRRLGRRPIRFFPFIHTFARKGLQVLKSIRTNSKKWTVGFLVANWLLAKAMKTYTRKPSIARRVLLRFFQQEVSA